jgi:hypothetical protein
MSLRTAINKEINKDITPKKMMDMAMNLNTDISYIYL